MIRKKRDNRKHVNAIYPWLEWFKKKEITLKKGKHFNCLPHSFGQQARNAAAKNGYKVSVCIYEDKVILMSKKQRKK